MSTRPEPWEYRTRLLPPARPPRRGRQRLHSRKVRAAIAGTVTAMAVAFTVSAPPWDSPAPPAAAAARPAQLGDRSPLVRMPVPGQVPQPMAPGIYTINNEVFRSDVWVITLYQVWVVSPERFVVFVVVTNLTGVPQTFSCAGVDYLRLLSGQIVYPTQTYCSTFPGKQVVIPAYGYFRDFAVYPIAPPPSGQFGLVWQQGTSTSVSTSNININNAPVQNITVQQQQIIQQNIQVWVRPKKNPKQDLDPVKGIQNKLPGMSPPPSPGPSGPGPSGSVSPGTPTISGTPSTPGSPSTPSAPGTPATPGTPGTPGTPATPGTPGTPGTPVIPGTPGTPGQVPTGPGQAPPPGGPTGPGQPPPPGVPGGPAQPPPGGPAQPQNPGGQPPQQGGQPQQQNQGGQPQR